MKVAQNEKRKKLLGFSFYINIGNFEAFLWNLNLSTNRLFWRCARAAGLGQNFVGLFYYPDYVEADRPISQMIAQKRASM